MDKIIPLYVTVINGEVQENPVLIRFRCDGMVPLEKAIDIVRYFDDALCQVAKRIFLFRYEQNVFGTSQFKTVADFWQWHTAMCGTNYFLLNGCRMILNGQPVSYTLNP